MNFIKHLRYEGNNGGKKGKGHQKTCIKYPWTKPTEGRIEGGRGWGGRKWWWENGDHCIQTLIKND